MNLLDLPTCMLEQIFENLSYDEVAKHRLVKTKYTHSTTQNEFTKIQLSRFPRT